MSRKRGGYLHRRLIVLISCKITLMTFHHRHWHQGSDLKLEISIILRTLNSRCPNLRRHILPDLKFSPLSPCLLTICALVKSCHFHFCKSCINVFFIAELKLHILYLSADNLSWLIFHSDETLASEYFLPFLLIVGL